jgi:hypothetical protein
MVCSVHLSGHIERRSLAEAGNLLIFAFLEREGMPVHGPLLLRPDEGIIVKLGT